MNDNDELRRLLEDFENKEEALKGARAKYVGISPALSFDPENVLSPGAVEEMQAAEADMHEAWLRFIEAARRIGERSARA